MNISSRESTWYSVGLTLICLAALVALVEPLSLLFRLIPRTYNEGWNAFWADAATHSGALYMPVDSLIANNYPPLSFYLVGLVGRVVGDNVIAGRLVSLASFGVIVAAAYLFLRAVGSSQRIAFTGAALIFATLVHFAEAYVAMNDPQLLAHAFMLSALVVLWRLDFSPLAVIVGATLMLLGGFTKHLLIPLPMAVTLWIAIYRRERLASWLTCFAVGLPLGFWLISSTWPSFVAELLSPRSYSLRRAASAGLHALLRLLPLLAVGLIPYFVRKRVPLSPRLTFALIYMMLALVVGVMAAGGEGVTRNAFFDLLFASALLAALALEWMFEHSRTQRFFGLSAAPAVTVAFGIVLTVSAIVSVPHIVQGVRDLDAREQDTREAVELIQRLGKGRPACETLALCYWAREPFTIDFFTYGQKLRTGALPVEPCEAAFQSGEYPVLQLDVERKKRGDRLWQCSAAIRRYYTEALRSSVGSIWVPKQQVAGL
jgi:hypothetical protein